MKYMEVLVAKFRKSITCNCNYNYSNKDKIKPQKGDMVLFQGGNIWHRVETVRGKTPRITLGGFIGFSKNGEKIYYWS